MWFCTWNGVIPASSSDQDLTGRSSMKQNLGVVVDSKPLVHPWSSGLWQAYYNQPRDEIVP